MFYDIQLHRLQNHRRGAQILFINPHCLKIRLGEILLIARAANPNLIVILLTDELSTNKLLVDLKEGNDILRQWVYTLRPEDARISKSNALDSHELDTLFQGLETMSKKAEHAKAAQAHNESERERNESPHRKC